MSISLCLSLCLSVSISLCLLLCLSVYVSLSLSLSVCFYVSLSMSLCLYLSLSASMSLCLYLSLSVSMSLCLSPSVCLYVSLCVPPHQPIAPHCLSKGWTLIRLQDSKIFVRLLQRMKSSRRSVCFHRGNHCELALSEEFPNGRFSSHGRRRKNGRGWVKMERVGALYCNKRREMTLRRKWRKRGWGKGSGVKASKIWFRSGLKFSEKWERIQNL